MDHINSLVDHTFSWHTALTLAYDSGEAYKSEERMKGRILDEWGYEQLTFISEADTQLFVATVANKMVISFRGTESVQDLITDMQLSWSDECAYGQVHGGFYNAYKVVEEALQQVLDQIDMTDKKIWVTGHSLGAALAALCVAELEPLYGSQIMGCYTFGQPRTGNAAFVDFIAQKYAHRLFRIVNNDDIVPRVPPGFEHIGDLYRFGEDETLISSPKAGGRAMTLSTGSSKDSNEIPPLSIEEFAQLKDGLDNPQAGTLGVLDYFTSIKSHLVSEYVDKIQRHIDSPLFGLNLD